MAMQRHAPRDIAQVTVPGFHWKMPRHRHARKGEKGPAQDRRRSIHYVVFLPEIAVIYHRKCSRTNYPKHIFFWKQICFLFPNPWLPTRSQNLRPEEIRGLEKALIAWLTPGRDWSIGAGMVPAPSPDRHAPRQQPTDHDPTRSLHPCLGATRSPPRQPCASFRAGLFSHHGSLWTGPSLPPCLPPVGTDGGE